jgi:hypothetical protein
MGGAALAREQNCAHRRFTRQLAESSTDDTSACCAADLASSRSCVEFFGVVDTIAENMLGLILAKRAKPRNTDEPKRLLSPSKAYSQTRFTQTQTHQIM